MNHQAFTPEGGPVMPPNKPGGWPGDATHPLPAPSADPGATPLTNGGHVTAAPPPSNTSSEVSDPFDLERFGRSEREVSMALNDMATSTSDGGAVFDAVIPGSPGPVAPASSPVRGPASPTPSAMIVDLGLVNRALESQLYAAENNHAGEANGFGPNGFAAEEGEVEGGWETVRLSSNGVEDAPIGAAGSFGSGRTEDGAAGVSDSVLFQRGVPRPLEPQVGSSSTLQPQLQGGTRNTLLGGESRPVFPPQQRAHRVNGYINGARGFTPATTTTTTAATTAATTTVTTTATTTGATYGATSSFSAASGGQASFYDDSLARRMITNPPPTLPFSLVPLSHASNVQMANRFLGTEDQTFLSNYLLDEIRPATTAPVSFINRPPRSHRRLASPSENEAIDSYGRPSHTMRRNPSLSQLIGEPGPSTTTTTTPWRSALLRPVRAVSDTVQSTRSRVRRPRISHHQSFGMSRLDSEPHLFSGSNDSIERIRERARRHRRTPPAGLLFGDMNSPNNLAFVD